MRTIKFRAWDELNQEMVYEKTGMFSGGKSSWEILKLYETVMQFTGLTDKNGKEIYEGDILKCWDNCVVDEWSKYHTGLICYRGIQFTLKVDNTYLDLFYNAENIEIIGNIHENPELL